LQPFSVNNSGFPLLIYITAAASATAAKVISSVLMSVETVQLYEVVHCFH